MMAPTNRTGPFTTESPRRMGTRTGFLMLAVAGVAIGALASAQSLSERKGTATRKAAAVPHRQNDPGVDTANAVFNPLIRVRLGDHRRNELTLAVDGPYRLQPVGSKQVLGRGERLAPAAVSVSETGFRIGSRQLSVARLEVVPQKPASIWVDGHRYRGRLRLFRVGRQSMLAVNVVPLEDYLASVVDSEMPRSFPDEARKAQAVAARTYALWCRERSNDESAFDLDATTASQKYLGVEYIAEDGRRLAGESADSRRIVAQTAGVVCTYRGRLFPAWYSAVCGGRTTFGEELTDETAPPLTSVPCTWCRDASRYRWKVRLDRDVFERRLRELFGSDDEPPFASLKQIRLRATQPGRLPRFEFNVGDGLKHELSGDELRRHLVEARLPSPHFTVRLEGDSVTFTGRGHGHGVGLCQWGARGQALAGRSFTQILAYYYPGCRIVRLEP